MINNLSCGEKKCFYASQELLRLLFIAEIAKMFLIRQLKIFI